MTIQQMQKMIDNNNKSIEMFVKSQRKPGKFYGFGKAKNFKIKEVKNDTESQTY